MNEDQEKRLREFFHNEPKAIDLLLVIEHRITGKREERKLQVRYLSIPEGLMDLVNGFKRYNPEYKLLTILHGNTGEILFEPFFPDAPTE